MTKSFVFWKNGKPSLLCTKESDTEYFVENGAWSFTMTGELTAEIDQTGDKITFDKITVAPKGRDYNDILNKAEQEQS